MLLNPAMSNNLNYWTFGDYIGIGCGAHGKITDVQTDKIFRTIKVKHPKGYLDTDRPHLDQLREVTQEELPFEFMMNQLRLRQPFTLSHFSQHTGLAKHNIADTLEQARAKQLMDNIDEAWQVTSLGHRYLNDLLEMFL